MPNIPVPNNNFAAGEIDPSIRSRDKTDLYQSGVERLRNMKARVQGGVETRPGMRFLNCPRVPVPSQFPVGTTISHPEAVNTQDRAVRTLTQPSASTPLAPLGINGFTFVGVSGNDYLFQAEWPEIEGIANKYAFLSLFFQVEGNPYSLFAFLVEYKNAAGNWVQWGSSNYEIHRGQHISYRWNFDVDTRGLRYKALSLFSSTRYLSVSPVSIYTDETYAAEVDADSRIVAFEFSNNQQYLLVMLSGGGGVIKDGVQIATFPGPWTSAQIKELSFAHSLDTLLVFHPSFAPHAIQRTDDETEWSSYPWPINNIPKIGEAPKYADITIEADPNEEAGDDVDNRVWTFDTELGTSTTGITVTRIRGQDETLLHAYTLSLTDDGGTVTLATGVDLDVGDVLRVSQADTREETLSNDAGWPRCGAFFQGRLAMAGSASRPSSVWMSKSGDLHDFDNTKPDEDDNGIFITHNANSVGTIHAVQAGRHLQLFSDLAETYIPASSTEAITPRNVVIRETSERGTKIGVPPVDIDGATAAVQREGKALRSFVYSEGEGAYVTRSISLSAAHLISNPVDLVYVSAPSDSDTNLLFVVNAAGWLAVLAIDRNEDIYAWSRWDTDGCIYDVENLAGSVYAIVQRGDHTCLEVFDTDCELDSARKRLDRQPPRASNLVGMDASVVEDGRREDGLRIIDGGHLGTLRVRTSSVSWEVGLPWPAVEGQPDEPGNGWMVKTLPFIAQGEAGLRGVSRSTKRRIREASVEYQYSGGFWLNGNFMGLNGVDRVEDLADWTRKAQVTIRGDRPALLNSVDYEVSI